MDYSISVMNNPYTIKQTNWDSARLELSRIRRKVFIEEQQVPEELEWDAFDYDSIHLIATDTLHQAIGCLRLLPDGHIGRMAVLAEWRGKGVGMALLQRAIAVARHQGYRKVILNAQCHAIGFYLRAGFTVCSDEFFDAGIPHKTMEMMLK